MPGPRKLKAVRAVVRPHERSEYLARWWGFADGVRSLGANAWLFEDQGLAGRFMEFVEFRAAPGLEGRLRGAFEASKLGEVCVRREGDDLLFREVRSEGESGGGDGG